MLWWSWGTWPDPLVDYGTHLYVPWRLSVGQVLYRDIAYYNGPLSPYFNALLFRCFGVGMHTLIIANLLILAAALWLTDHLARRASGPAAAAMATLTFVMVFAFGQGVGIGNYNWVTPYAHEFTHGLVLGGVTLASLFRFQRTRRFRWLIVGGVACGAAILTKAELSAAALAGGSVQLLAGLWGERASASRWAGVTGVFAASVLAPPLIAAAALASVVPLHTAMLAAAGSWPWVFDRRVTALPFYRGLVGLDAVPRHLKKMALWTGVYLAVFLPAAGLSLAATQRSLARKLSATAVLMAGLWFAWSQFRTDFNSMVRPLPLVLLVAGGVAAFQLFRLRPPLPPGEGAAKAHADVSVAPGTLRLGLIVFSLALLPKMILEAHLFHYGFVLTLPGTLVLVALAAEEIPRSLSARRGNPAVFRAVAAAVWAAAVAVTLYVDHGYFGTKQWTILPGTPDRFRGASRALEVQQMVRLIDQTTTPGQTLAVFPQGLMINYLARRVAPNPYVNFMPPEVITVGEATILAALAAHPPGAIVLTYSTLDPTGTCFTLDQQYSYGAATLAWIKAHYEVVAAPALPKALGTYLQLILMRPAGQGGQGGQGGQERGG